MKEIKLYYDSERTKEVSGDIEFEVVDAGVKSKRELFIFNDLNFKVDIDLSVEGNDIKITKNVTQLIPKQSKKIEFELFPKLTTMKPVTAKLNIKLDYTLR